MISIQTLTLLVALLAVIISFISLVRTRNIAKEQLELEKVTAELSKLQIQNIEEIRKSQTEPKFNVTLTTLGSSSYFYISNTGQGTAYNVNFELVDCEDSPVISDFSDKFPHPEMKPNSRLKLNATMHLGSPTRYQVKLQWINSEGEDQYEIFWVTR